MCFQLQHTSLQLRLFFFGRRRPLSGSHSSLRYRTPQRSMITKPDFTRPGHTVMDGAVFAYGVNEQKKSNRYAGTGRHISSASLIVAAFRVGPKAFCHAACSTRNGAGVNFKLSHSPRPPPTAPGNDVVHGAHYNCNICLPHHVHILKLCSGDVRKLLYGTLNSRRFR